MTIEALCQAAVVVSDNAAANLLLARLGGPDAFNAVLRRWDDRTTRLDRIEPALNENAPGDSRDSTTPSAMLGLLRTLMFGEPIWHASRVKLANWMVAANTGRDRLRAGFPEGWTAGDKTGTGMNGAHNDVAFALPPDGAEPILVASYISGGDASAEVRSGVHAEVARIVTAQAG
jgi:beta-lactamase class A